ncbi:hypothetical protein BOX15_Mlig034484g1, partial [Macrostomum lignano]
VPMTDQADDPDHHAGGGSDDERLETEQDLMNLAPLVIPPKPADLPMTGEEQGRARLMISQIVNRNFKSYAGERILGPFHQNFTAIVGPNGSGKSNVIDSMLFVFGYRASKIRSKKLSSLIHSSENFAAIDSCTVEIHFQRVVDREDGGYDIVEGSQFSVARTAFKDNASYYTVNGRRHEYKKVAELLLRVGIDLTHNRFLILQGEVEQISLMKPIAPNEHEEGLLEYLEDIIGSSRFKNPLTRIVRRIDALNDLRLEKVNQVKAVEKQKADLQGERDKALQYLRLCNQIVSKKNILFQIYRRECAATIDSMRGEQEQRQSELDAALAKLQEAKQQSKRKVEENKEIVKAYQEQQTIYTVTKEKFTALEVEDASLREEYKRMKAQGKKTVRLAEEEASKIEELKRAPEDAEKRLAELAEKLVELEKQRVEEEANRQTALNAIEAETKDLRAEKVIAERQLADLQKDANAKRSARDMARTELDILLSGQTRALQRLDAAKQDADGVERALAEKTAIRDRAAKETPEMQKSLERARRDEAALQQREAGLAEEARGLRVRVDEARRQLEQRSQSRVLQALLEQKKRGRFTGVRGRLGDLGAIDERYDVAMSTACGPLDDIVVDTIATGEACVRFLKEQRIGTATFIALDKMEQWAAESSKRCNAPIPRLFDLLQVPDPKVRNAFYYAIRDTLVAKDLDEATRVAYGTPRYRVVSEQGGLIELSGTMSGGGRPTRGRIGTRVNLDASTVGGSAMAAAAGSGGEESAQEAEKRLADLTAQLNGLRDERARLGETIAGLERDLRQLARNSDAVEREVARLGERRRAAREVLADAERRAAEAEPDAKALDKLRQRLETAEAEQKTSSDAAGKAETEVAQLDSRIMEVGGARLQVIQSRLDAVLAEIKKQKALSTKVKVAASTAERKVRESEERLARLETEKEECKTRLATIGDRMNQLEGECRDLMNRHKAAQEEVKKWQEKVDSMKAELEELEKEEQSLRKLEVDLRHKLQSVVGVIEEHERKRRGWERELQQLQLHRIQDDEEEAEEAERERVRREEAEAAAAAAAASSQEEEESDEDEEDDESADEDGDESEAEEAEENEEHAAMEVDGSDADEDQSNKDEAAEPADDEEQVEQQMQLVPVAASGSAHEEDDKEEADNDAAMEEEEENPEAEPEVPADGGDEAEDEDAADAVKSEPVESGDEPPKSKRRRTDEGVQSSKPGQQQKEKRRGKKLSKKQKRRAEKQKRQKQSAEAAAAERQQRPRFSVEDMWKLPTLPDAELDELRNSGLRTQIQQLEDEVGRMQPDMSALDEYRQKEAAYLAKVGELNRVTTVRDEQRRLHEEWRHARLTEFMSGFRIITGKLKEMYQMITIGGDAELELVDSLDPFTEGVVFSVRPPKKSWKSIGNLSGGEKTLSSLALVFALHHYKPTPLYFMDEIDAALDFKNVSIVANYIKRCARNAQFIVISLRNNMFELSDRLVGIYKTDNCTKSVTIDPEQVARAAHWLNSGCYARRVTAPNPLGANQA